MLIFENSVILGIIQLERQKITHVLGMNLGFIEIKQTESAQNDQQLALGIQTTWTPHENSV